MSFKEFERAWGLLNLSLKSYQKVLKEWIQTHIQLTVSLDYEGDILKVDLEKEWGLSNETIEKMTQLEHAIKVSCQFFLYHSSVRIQGMVSFEQFQSFLLLHDIGKNLSKRLTGDKKNQHNFTFKIMRSIWEKKNKKSWIPLSNSLLFNDPLGTLLKGKVEPKECIEIIEKGASLSQYSPSNFFRIMLLYYMCDASSYQTLMKNVFQVSEGVLGVKKEHKRYLEYKKVCQAFKYVPI